MTTTGQRTAQQDAVSGNLLGPSAPGNNFYLHHDFHYLPQRSSQNLGRSSKSQIRLVDPHFVIERAAAAAVLDSNGGVLVKASSSASSTIGQSIKPRTGSILAVTKFPTLSQSAMEVVFKAPAITTFQFQIGWVTSRVMNLTTDDYQAKFWFKSTTNATEVFAATSDNHTGAVLDRLYATGLHLEAGKVYKLSVDFDAEGRARFYGGVQGGDAKRLYVSERPITNAGASVNVLPVIQWGTTAKAAARNLTPYSATFVRKLT